MPRSRLDEKGEDKLPSSYQSGKGIQRLQGPRSPINQRITQPDPKQHQKSTELTNEIIQMYSKGYEAARNKDKAKLTVVALNADLLDSSEDKDKTEDNLEDDPPQP